jgi:tRNA(Arg) A34 adenosine deaminase TadA
MTRSISDSRGAVFVEKLIALLPLLLVFFLGWELAEVGAAQLVVQRASAAAGRAAMVVLPDEPTFYAGEEPDSYAGARRADVELAAGMVLSAIPQIGDGFEVEVSDPPLGFGKVDVTVTAPYDCGSLGLLCGRRDSLTLHATTTHAYHGAKYSYSVPDEGVSGTPQALTVAGTAQALTAQQSGSPGRSGAPRSNPGARSNSADGCGLPFACEGQKFADNRFISPERGTGNRVTPPKKGEGDPKTSAAARALEERCKQPRSGKNVAALSYRCDDGVEGTRFDVSVVGNPDDRRRTSNPNSNSNRHAEVLLLEKFRVDSAQLGKNCKVTELYTEREPCPFCRDEIMRRHQASFDAGYRVSYGFEWNVGDQRFDRSNPHKCSESHSTCSSLKNSLEQRNRHRSMSAAEIDACMKHAMWEEAANAQVDLRKQTNKDIKKQCSK